MDKQVKDFLKSNMYNHKKVIINTNKGKRIIKDLFKYLLKILKGILVRNCLIMKAKKE